ncbi:MAG: hypothetical protein ACOY82_01595 [Pseudomonadota bacterium]
MKPLLASPLLFAALLAATGAAAAQWRDREGRAVAETPSQRYEKGFGAMLRIATLAESERFHEEWYNTATEHAPTLATTDTAVRGDTVSILILYAGCAPQGADEADIAAGRIACPAMLDLRVFAPDGTVYAHPEEMPLAQDQPAGPAGIVQLSPVEVRMQFEPQDPLGVYRVEARIDEPERDAVLELSTSIELKADGSKE